MENIDRLLEKSCHIIDFIPFRVPKDSKGQFFNVESYFLNDPKSFSIKNRIICIILKIMCYYESKVFIDNKWILNPKPSEIVKIIEDIVTNRLDTMNIIFPEKDFLLVFEGDSLHMSLYNLDNELCDLLEKISSSEGMFFRESEV